MTGEMRGGTTLTDRIVWGLDKLFIMPSTSFLTLDDLIGGFFGGFVTEAPGFERFACTVTDFPTDLSAISLSTGELLAFGRWYYNQFLAPFGPHLRAVSFYRPDAPEWLVALDTLRESMAARFMPSLLGLYSAKYELAGIFGDTNESALRARAFLPTDVDQTTWNTSVFAGWVPLWSFKLNAFQPPSPPRQNRMVLLLMGAVEDVHHPNVLGLKTRNDRLDPPTLTTPSVPHQLPFGGPDTRLFLSPAVHYVGKNRSATMEVLCERYGAAHLAPLGIVFYIGNPP